MDNEITLWRKANAALGHPKLTIEQRDYWMRVRRDILRKGYKP